MKDKTQFFITDVFGETKYSGNQLATFVNAASLSTEEMQNIAREIHFSETTFILSDQEKDGGYDARIFTPAAEIDFAGHPTLGTAYIVREHILKETHRLFVHVLPQNGELRIELLVLVVVLIEVAQMQPLAGELDRQPSCAGILQHSPRLATKLFGRRQAGGADAFVAVPQSLMAGRQTARISDCAQLDIR